MCKVLNIKVIKGRKICLFLLFFALDINVYAIQDSSEYYYDLYKSLKKDYTFKNWESTREIEHCINFFTRIKDSVLLSESIICLSNFEASQGKYNNTFIALWKSLAIAEEIGDIRLQHDAHVYLARLYKIFDKNDEALVHEQTVLELAKVGVKQGVILKSGIVSAYFSFVHSFHKIGQNDKAMAYLDTCFDLADKFNYTYDERAYLIFKKGHLLLYHGKVKEAILILEESKRNFQRINPGFLSIVYFHLGGAYETDGKLLLAKDYYLKAIDNIDKTNSHFDTKAEILMRLSKILNGLGKHKEAYAVLTQSKQLNDKLFSAKSYQNVSLLSIRNVHQEQMRRKDAIIMQRDRELIEQRAEVMRFRLFLFATIALLTIGILFWYLYYQRRKFKAEKDAQHTRSQLRDQENRALVEIKNKELTSFTLRLIDKDSLINDLVDTIEEYAPANEQLLKSVKLRTTGRIKLWKEFDKRFIDVNKGFYENLKSKFPDLTPTELKHCALIKLNFSAKEMAQLLNISLNGVNTSRYRIRKKLKLEREDNLVSIISLL